MYHAKILCAPDARGTAVPAADVFRDVLLAKPDAVLGLATGSTPLPLYGELIRRQKAGLMDFSRARTVNLDEYAGLGPDHPQSYRRFMQENLFDRLPIPRENTLVPDGLAADPAAMCADYDRRIEAWGGVDLQLLGIGHDGHIGFNEPDDVFPAGTHMVTLTQTTRRANARFFRSMDEVPAAAYTMGIGAIMAARRILLLVTGADKRDVLRRALAGPVTPRLPASILQFHPDVTVICDAAARPQTGQE